MTLLYTDTLDLYNTIMYHAHRVEDLKNIIKDYEYDTFFDDVRDTETFKDNFSGYKEELKIEELLLGWLKELKYRRRIGKRCDICTHHKELTGENCYACIKGIENNFEHVNYDI